MVTPSVVAFCFDTHNNENNYRCCSGCGYAKEAYEKTGNLNLSDDASVYQEVYGDVSLIKGFPYNIKITNPLDIKIAQVIAEDLSSCTI